MLTEAGMKSACSACAYFDTFELIPTIETKPQHTFVCIELLSVLYYALLQTDIVACSADLFWFRFTMHTNPWHKTHSNALIE